MNSRNLVLFAVLLIVYLLAQIILFKNLVIFDVAFCFVYIGFLLALPFDIDRLVLMGIGFFTGFMVDIFYDTLGMHAASSVLIMYLRPMYFQLVAPQGGYDVRIVPSIRDMGFVWFSVFTLIFVFIHHLVIFFLEAGGGKMFFYTLLKVLFSTLFTSFVILLVQYIFYPPRR